MKGISRLERRLVVGFCFPAALDSMIALRPTEKERLFETDILDTRFTEWSFHMKVPFGTGDFQGNSLNVYSRRLKNIGGNLSP